VRAYFDSCIVIYLIEKRQPWHGVIRNALTRLSAPDSAVVFTDLNRLECRVLPIAAGMPGLLADYDAFFASDGLIRHGLHTDTFDLATDLRARYRLKTPDALHLAAAITAGCDEFWTNDRRLEDAAAGRISVVTFVKGI